jgi:hypothetical protein
METMADFAHDNVRPDHSLNGTQRRIMLSFFKLLSNLSAERRLVIRCIRHIRLDPYACHAPSLRTPVAEPNTQYPIDISNIRRKAILWTGSRSLKDLYNELPTRECSHGNEDRMQDSQRQVETSQEDTQAALAR